jgi:hypothetical protein
VGKEGFVCDATTGIDRSNDSRARLLTVGYGRVDRPDFVRAAIRAIAQNINKTSHPRLDSGG